MKIKALRPQTFVKQLRCDRCARTADEGDWEFLEFTSIEYTAGYGSILGDGNGIAIDLCQHCLREALGPWLRIDDPLGKDDHLQQALDQFDPVKHGGEFPAEPRKITSKSDHTTVLTAERPPKPPDGFSSWLQYAVANIDLRQAQQVYLFSDEEPPSRDSIRAALQREVTSQMSSTTSNLPVSICLSGRELKALFKFKHEDACTGEVYLRASETGIGTALDVTCSKNCRTTMNITDYSIW